MMGVKLHGFTKKEKELKYCEVVKLDPHKFELSKKTFPVLMNISFLNTY